MSFEVGEIIAPPLHSLHQTPKTLVIHITSNKPSCLLLFGNWNNPDNKVMFHAHPASRDGTVSADMNSLFISKYVDWRRFVIIVEDCLNSSLHSLIRVTACRLYG